MRKVQRYISVIVCVCFVLASILSIVFVAAHTGHECGGEHCEICLQLSHITDRLKQVKPAPLPAALSLAAILAVLFPVCGGMGAGFVTPVLLKVQMNN